MYEARKKELKKIKDEKRKTIEDIQYKINGLNQALRIALDEHNRAAWCIEELERLEKPTETTDKELIEDKERKSE